MVLPARVLFTHEGTVSTEDTIPCPVLLLGNSVEPSPLREDVGPSTPSPRGISEVVLAVPPLSWSDSSP